MPNPAHTARPVKDLLPLPSSTLLYSDSPISDPAGNASTRCLPHPVFLADGESPPRRCTLYPRRLLLDEPCCVVPSKISSTTMNESLAARNGRPTHRTREHTLYPRTAEKYVLHESFRNAYPWCNEAAQRIQLAVMLMQSEPPSLPRRL